MAPGSPHLHRTHPDVASNAPVRPFFFPILADSTRFRQKQEPKQQNRSDFNQNNKISPISAKTNQYGPKWAVGHHSSTSCGLVRGKKKKKDEKTQKKWLEEE